MTQTIVYAYTKSEERKLPKERAELPPLFDEPTTLNNWYKHINWVHAILLLGTPAVAFYGAWTTELLSKTLVFAFIYYHVTVLGITAGYHRMWSHRAYRAVLPLRWIYCLAGSGAIEGSIYWWCRGHRAHHRWTDTDKDPYSAHRGLFFSHLGWMLVKRPKSKIGYADTADLKADPVVAIQHTYYPFFALGMGFLFPTLLAGLGWGDYRGGFFYAGAVRLVLVHHATFCVNSLAHYLGEDTYDDHHTSRDHWLTALVTNGEGYHNFHHEFPQDYRNAIRYYQYDPTKWLIKALSYIGLAYELKTFPSNEVTKSIVQMQEKKILACKKGLAYGPNIEDLPVFTWEEFQNLVLNANKKWIAIEGILYDLKAFAKEHPGGEKCLKSNYGKDMTTAFNGGVYDHSNGARNLLTRMRVGVLKHGMQLMSDGEGAQ
ncbi:stearoyl-CoA desaturase [Dichotomocladium elegans]|nr:stearoyl-CoA desaturase [Dichotomocladium elegans]